MISETVFSDTHNRRHSKAFKQTRLSWNEEGEGEGEREGGREREGYCISIKDLILTSQLDILINASAIVKLVVPLSLLS